MNKTLQQIYEDYENARLRYYDYYIRSCDDEPFRKQFLEAKKKLEEAIEELSKDEPYLID